MCYRNTGISLIRPTHLLNENSDCLQLPLYVLKYWQVLTREKGNVDEGDQKGIRLNLNFKDTSSSRNIIIIIRFEKFRIASQIPEQGGTEWWNDSGWSTIG